MVLGTCHLPACDAHTHTVIFLHGRGSCNRDFCEDLWDTHDSTGRPLQHVFPAVRWVFPQAEEANQWFEIRDAADPDAHREHQADDLRNVVPKLVRLVRSEADRVGGLRNVVLAGISQGCAAAVHALLNFPKPASGDQDQDQVQDRLCAFLGISGWMALAAESAQQSRNLLGLEGVTTDDDLLRNTPVFLSHSADDNIVPVEQGRRLRDVLQRYGMKVTWKEYERGAHWISPEGVDNIVNFLKAQGLKAV
ncbi:phospholipase/carboxylesterase family protein [Xylariomycetidae sp. FL0641]|nr:phospholipase/carboxylesterase family protein [Xylariomycetidae sp. FL0641]